MFDSEIQFRNLIKSGSRGAGVPPRGDKNYPLNKILIMRQPHNSHVGHMMLGASKGDDKITN